jgi:hypothetical protein
MTPDAATALFYAVERNERRRRREALLDRRAAVANDEAFRDHLNDLQQNGR